MEKMLLIQMTPEELKDIIVEVINDHLNDLKEETQPKEPEELLTRVEVAKLLKISLPTLHEWTKEGMLQSYGIRNRVLYKRSEIMSSLRKREFGFRGRF